MFGFSIAEVAASFFWQLKKKTDAAHNKIIDFMIQI